MKHLRFPIAAVLAATMGIATAQAQAGPGDRGHMQMGAGMEMMGGAMHQVVMTPFLLPELQSELGLTAQQAAQLQQLKQEMLARGKELSSQIAAKRKELDALLAPGTSKGEQVKRLFEQMARLRALQFYTGYETATKMKAALTDAQRSKLAAMKPGEFHQAAMAHTTLNDLSQMMEFVGGGMMMGQGMMDMPGVSPH